MTTTNRTEAYWTQRNALVDAVHAAGANVPKDWALIGQWTHSEQGVQYTAALDALKAFDAANGGAPIL